MMTWDVLTVAGMDGWMDGYCDRWMDGGGEERKE